MRLDVEIIVLNATDNAVYGRYVVGTIKANLTKSTSTSTHPQKGDAHMPSSSGPTEREDCPLLAPSHMQRSSADLRSGGDFATVENGHTVCANTDLVQSTTA